MALTMGVIAGNNLIIAGSLVLLLVVGFVADCKGKPFHSVGQDEIEEDTSQGSLKDRFPQHLLSSGGLDDVDDLTVGTDNDEETTGWRVGDYFPNTHSPGSLHAHQHRYLNPQESGDALRNIVDGSRDANNYAYPEGAIEPVHKRSLVRNPSSSSASVEERYPSYFPSGNQQSPSSLPSSDIINSSENPGLRFRQRILNLRNQYGDKWYAMVGPYAYRKRQILYRQCFFNPISCF